MKDSEFAEATAYEPSPLDMSGLERTAIRVPARLLDEAFGYKGNARYVSFHWSPRHKKLFVCDGPLRVQLADCVAWPSFLAHPLITPHLQQFTADYKRVETLDFSVSVVPLAQTSLFSTEDDARQMDADVVTTCLVVDRRDAEVYAGPWSAALTFHSLMSGEILEDCEAEGPGVTTDDTEERLLTWLNEHLDDADQWFNVAATYHRFRQYEQALAALLRCVEFRPESDLFHLRLSQTYADLDRWDDALVVCEKAARLQAVATRREVTSQAIFTWLGRCQFEVGRYREASDSYELVTQIDPHLAGVEAYHQLGRCYTKLGCHGEAIEAHENALRLQIDKAGESLLSMDWEDDLGEYGPVLAEIDRGLVAASLEALAKAHLLAGNLGEAEDAFREALKVEPTSVRAQACLALVHHLLGKRSIAAEEFKIATARARLMIEYQPDSAHAHADLAFVYKLSRDDAPAAEEYRRAFEQGWRTDPDEDLFAIVAHLSSRPTAW